MTKPDQRDINQAVHKIAEGLVETRRIAVREDEAVRGLVKAFKEAMEYVQFKGGKNLYLNLEKTLARFEKKHGKGGGV